jgi:hypothetical protein
MDPVRFDQMSKRWAARLTRRRAVQALGAVGVAGTLLGVRQEHAAADCPDAYLKCVLPNQGGEKILHSYGQCWNWSTFVCEPCPSSIEIATKRCNKVYPDCLGQCVAVFSFVLTTE